MFKIKPYSIFVFSWLVPLKVWAAACCGGSISMPAMISGDDKIQMSLSRSEMTVTDDVDTMGTWRSRGQPESVSTWTVEGARIFQDRWQAGGSVPVITRERAGHSSSGAGDVTANLGYEYLPDWDYNPWRPKGLGFVQLVAPTGVAAIESEGPFQLDSRGRGFWALGAGTLLTKIWGRWDAMASLGLHRSLDKKYSTSQSAGNLHPGWGGSMGVGAGYNYRQFRLGGNLTWNYEDPIDVSGTINAQGSAQRYGTASALLTFLPADEWGITVAYQDQRLIGNPGNASLGRGVQLQLQYKISR